MNWPTPPKDLKENLLYRAFVWNVCEKSKRHRESMIELCKRDVLYFVNSWVWQVNPKHVGYEVGPFITWPYQDEAILATLHRNLVEQDDMLWEKSREMGATWMALIMDLWGCLFHQWRKYLWISHSEQAVDRPADPDSLFWKIRFMLDHLPAWMTEGAEKRKLGFHFKRTSSSMNGAASTGRSGVGGRATRVGLDEFSKQQQASEILGQTADTGPRLFIGTHYGTGGPFYDLTRRPDMRKIVMHWTQHPEKRKGMYRFIEAENRIEILDPNDPPPIDYDFVHSEAPFGGPFPGIRSPWYDKECARRASPRDVAMHLDIDAQGSQSQFFNALAIRSLVNTYCTAPTEWDLSHDNGRPIDMTPREGGIIKLWVTPIHGIEFPRAPYACGVDVATGTGATNSVASFGNAQTGEKICEIATPNMRPDNFAPLVVAVCRMLKDENGVPAKLCWETPGPGHTFGDVVMSLGYTNVHYRSTQVSSIAAAGSKIAGWNNQGNASQPLLEHYRGALDSHKFINRCQLALEECLHYRYSGLTVDHPGKTNTNDPSGARVNHGDRVMADALCWKMMSSLQAPVQSVSLSEEIPVWSLAWRRKKRSARAAMSQW